MSHTHSQANDVADDTRCEVATARNLFFSCEFELLVSSPLWPGLHVSPVFPYSIVVMFERQWDRDRVSFDICTLKLAICPHNLSRSVFTFGAAGFCFEYSSYSSIQGRSRAGGTKVSVVSSVMGSAH